MEDTDTYVALIRIFAADTSISEAAMGISDAGIHPSEEVTEAAVSDTGTSISVVIKDIPDVGIRALKVAMGEAAIVIDSRSTQHDAKHA
ncbi:hypothetical protein [Nitrosomonas marina]|uniref:hypothetical protein n=1 Tax=Nitrosomonas marina TaxID=917 RepID=UPI000B89EBB8|nr:hypothetical protein [Nitrosomonas marina]